MTRAYNIVAHLPCMAGNACHDEMVQCAICMHSDGLLYYDAVPEALAGAGHRRIAELTCMSRPRCRKVS